MAEARKNRVKLQDIAQASGVSLTAVSLALSDKPGISQETRVRVLEVARSMGYRFKAPAAAAPAKAIKTIGLLVKASLGDEPHANHFYSPIIAGVEMTCRQMGINLMFASLPVDTENVPLETPALLEKGGVDGILLTGSLVDDALAEMLISQNCPVVLVDSYATSRLFNAVLMDNAYGAYQAAQYLINKGHRQIGFIGGSEQAYPSFRDRRAGYREALADAGISGAYLADCSSNRAEISSAVLDLVRQHREVTGLVCVNDDTAITAMYALIEAGYRVPQDISIIGFDDIYLAESVVPALTTMRINKQSMGRLAVQLLLNQVYQVDGGVVTSIFRSSLVERNSVANLYQPVILREEVASKKDMT